MPYLRIHNAHCQLFHQNCITSCVCYQCNQWHGSFITPGCPGQDGFQYVTEPRDHSRMQYVSGPPAHQSALSMWVLPLNVPPPPFGRVNLQFVGLADGGGGVYSHLQS